MVSALLPLLLSSAFFDGFDHPRMPSRLLDQDFGLGLRPEQLMLPRRDLFSLSARDRALLNLFDIYYRPLPDVYRPSGGGAASRRYIDKDTFKVILDVQQFKPEEIEVKVVDNSLVVSAKHEEKQDEHGLISRQFVRRYTLPDGVEPDTVTSEISSDGVLTIKAPLKELPENKNERKVKIELTGKPALKPQEEQPAAENKEGTTTTATPAEATTAQEQASTTAEK